MIQKIQSNEYLKRVDNMSAVEREDYMKKVEGWLQKERTLLMPKMEEPTATFQNVVQCSSGWNDAECQAWTNGARLLTALTGKAETWLPELLYTKAAKRAIRNMVSCLKWLIADESCDGIAEQQTRKDAEMMNRDGRAEQRTKGATEQQSSGIVTEHQTGGKPVRPAHLDQYIYLLPESTQKKAETVKGLLRDMDAARENARLLTKDPNANPKAIAQWAKMVTDIDARMHNIYKEIDEEWEKLVNSGRVVVDAFGNASVREDAEQQPKRKPGRPTMTEEEKKAAAEKRAAEREAKIAEAKRAEEAESDEKRRQYLKKWLRDTRTKPSEERRKQWEKNCKELLSLDGVITDSIRKAAKYYGVKL